MRIILSNTGIGPTTLVALLGCRFYLFLLQNLSPFDRETDVCAIIHRSI